MIDVERTTSREPIGTAPLIELLDTYNDDNLAYHLEEFTRYVHSDRSHSTLDDEGYQKWCKEHPVSDEETYQGIVADYQRRTDELIIRLGIESPDSLEDLLAAHHTLRMLSYGETDSTRKPSYVTDSIFGAKTLDRFINGMVIFSRLSGDTLGVDIMENEIDILPTDTMEDTKRRLAESLREGRTVWRFETWNEQQRQLNRDYPYLFQDREVQQIDVSEIRQVLDDYPE